MDDVYIKPINIEKLASLVKETLNKKQKKNTLSWFYDFKIIVNCSFLGSSREQLIAGDEGTSHASHSYVSIAELKSEQLLGEPIGLRSCDCVSEVLE